LGYLLALGVFEQFMIGAKVVLGKITEKIPVKLQEIDLELKSKVPL